MTGDWSFIITSTTPTTLTRWMPASQLFQRNVNPRSAVCHQQHQDVWLQHGESISFELLPDIYAYDEPQSSFAKLSDLGL